MDTTMGQGEVPDLLGAGATRFAYGDKTSQASPQFTSQKLYKRTKGALWDYILVLRPSFLEFMSSLTAQRHSRDVQV